MKGKQPREHPQMRASNVGRDPSTPRIRAPNRNNWREASQGAMVATASMERRAWTACPASTVAMDATAWTARTARTARMGRGASAGLRALKGRRVRLASEASRGRPASRAHPDRPGFVFTNPSLIAR